ncbi:MAG: hypothetical protein A2Y45_07410 [Tenericutes bacterium GWC2_34_14]|nr:MAG: hypothetical protein A2Y45_07410 [Tenericutes bacterium GWC2_34_14]OHE34713.1 MAG: hypothetical protein A2012_01020 [Tenericutes bacterium GWE2_34_108]OHE37426.1 MAG: hypothetical protein A2Y46_01990 [Tenericutes bacterium GWF1_35_14]OHE39440.1 MAG: hypothetical protein A2Y44_00870 [Tenericutes bacterium GWF2_35_184]OHE44371.1 MAG: hypothetical protein A2221_04640 [Tenericutes bacterium RIFOXYA2_FULL_36_32]OHE47203.1 MAG: hypothetical protein A2308_03020 [Tenericutes bacterium RIFOXYB2
MIQYIQQKRKKNLLMHGFILSGQLILYFLSVYLLNFDKLTTNIISIIILVGLMISLLLGARKIKHSLRLKKIKLKDNHYQVPYPPKFVDTMVEVGGFFKRYIHQNQVIPDYFIEFREGRTLYLYPLIQDITDESYTILKVNKFELALVLDEQNKKRIVHLGNAMLVD